MDKQNADEIAYRHRTLRLTLQETRPGEILKQILRTRQWLHKWHQPLCPRGRLRAAACPQWSGRDHQVTFRSGLRVPATMRHAAPSWQWFLSPIESSSVFPP